MKWYYEYDNEAIGPVTLEDLLPKITPETLVWREDSIEDWVPAKEHADLGLFLMNKSNPKISSGPANLKDDDRTTLVLKSNEKLVESNMDLIQKVGQHIEQNKKLEEESKNKEEKIKQLDEQNKLLQDKLTSLIQKSVQHNEQNKKLEEEKQSLETKYFESQEKALELSYKVKEYKHKLDSNNDKQIFENYIANKLSDGYSIVKKDDEILNVELYKKEAKVLPRGKMKFGLVVILLLCTCAGLLSGFAINDYNRWYRFPQREKNIDYFIECEPCTAEQEAEYQKKYNDYLRNYDREWSDWMESNRGKADANFIICISLSTLISIIIWRIRLFRFNKKPLVKLDSKVNAWIANNSIQEKFTEI